MARRFGPAARRAVARRADRAGDPFRKKRHLRLCPDRKRGGHSVRRDARADRTDVRHELWTDQKQALCKAAVSVSAHQRGVVRGLLPRHVRDRKGGYDRVFAGKRRIPAERRVQKRPRGNVRLLRRKGNAQNPQVRGTDTKSASVQPIASAARAVSRGIFAESRGRVRRRDRKDRIGSL